MSVLGSAILNSLKHSKYQTFKIYKDRKQKKKKKKILLYIQSLIWKNDYWELL